MGPVKSTSKSNRQSKSKSETVEQFIEGLPDTDDDVRLEWSKGKWYKIRDTNGFTTGGNFQVEYMTSTDGKWLVRFLHSGATLHDYSTQYTSEPSVATIIEDLKAKI